MYEQFMFREAVASVSLSHPETCKCQICRAAQGDEDAMEHLAIQLSAQAWRRYIREDVSRYTTGTGDTLFGIHDPELCKGRGCVIHHPSDHHMADWPTHWRSDLGMMERVCEHGNGHPDPDDLAYLGLVDHQHECCGCCRGGVDA